MKTFIIRSELPLFPIEIKDGKSKYALQVQADSITLEEVPVVKKHRWVFYMNGTYCGDCNESIGSGRPCR